MIEFNYFFVKLAVDFDDVKNEDRRFIKYKCLYFDFVEVFDKHKINVSLNTFL